MEKVSNFGSPMNISFKEQDKCPECYMYGVPDVDMKDLYSQEELDAIVGKFKCLHPTSPSGKIKCKFDMKYLPDMGCVIIDNKNMTNDTVEIYASGKAISVGSWHRNNLEGNYSDIINDVKARYDAKKAKGDAKITSDLDAMAELGKSQVKP